MSITVNLSFYKLFSYCNQYELRQYAMTYTGQNEMTYMYIWKVCNLYWDSVLHMTCIVLYVMTYILMVCYDLHQILDGML